MVSIERLAEDVGLGGPRRYQVDWERAESAVGTPLPSDYKEYVYWFGPGCIESFLYICTPGVENVNVELSGKLRLVGESFKRRREIDVNYKQPHPLFPEKEGWLPWGYTVDGDNLFWVVSSRDPNEWTIAAASRADDLGYFDGGFLDYLHSYVWDTGEMEFFPQEEGVDLPFRFYPLDGAWKGMGERLESYGYFEGH